MLQEHLHLVLAQQPMTTLLMPRLWTSNKSCLNKKRISQRSLM
jgi:hypothetical protein